MVVWLFLEKNEKVDVGGMLWMLGWENPFPYPGPLVGFSARAEIRFMKNKEEHVEIFTIGLCVTKFINCFYVSACRKDYEAYNAVSSGGNSVGIPNYSCFSYTNSS